MSLDSVAVFHQRLNQCNLGSHAATMEGLGWSTFGTFAMASTYVPGQPDITPFLVDIVEKVLGDRDDSARFALQRLYFEAYTILGEDIKRRASKTDEDQKPQALPELERIERMKALRERLPGLNLRGEREPAAYLVNRFHAMIESGVLLYVPWDKLGRRDLEIQAGPRVESYWKPDNNGAMREYNFKVEIPADVTTDLKLQMALQRRGAAMEVARLVHYEVHDGWMQTMFENMLIDPLPGYRRVSTTQLARADAELFRKLSVLAEGDLSIRPDGSYPLDNLFEIAQTDMRVVMNLMPSLLPAGANQREESWQQTDDRPEKFRKTDKPKAQKAKHQ